MSLTSDRINELIDQIATLTRERDEARAALAKCRDSVLMVAHQWEYGQSETLHRRLLSALSTPAPERREAERTDSERLNALFATRAWRSPLIQVRDREQLDAELAKGNPDRRPHSRCNPDTACAECRAALDALEGPRQ